MVLIVHLYLCDVYIYLVSCMGEQVTCEIYYLYTLQLEVIQYPPNLK